MTGSLCRRARKRCVGGLLAAIVVLAGLLSACAVGAPAADTTTVVVPAHSTSQVALQTRPPAPPHRQKSLGGDCVSLLPLPAVEAALGRMIVGKMVLVVGVPEKNIGRLAYLNCRYGIPRTAPGMPAEPLIEVGISLYRTPADAQQRITSTIFDYLANGAQRSTVRVGGHRAVLLAGSTAPGYTDLLVLGTGQRTVAVSVAERGGTTAWRRHAMITMALMATARTAG